MTTMSTRFRYRSFFEPFSMLISRWSIPWLILTIMLPTACTRLVQPGLQPDEPAQRMVAGLRQTNAGLIRFKCVAKITLSDPGRPTQSFRAAIAGQLTDHLRIDMFAPFGGSAGSVSSDGKHLFLVSHPSGKYYKKRIGNGSLRRIIHMDVTVGDLLELLVGRIPMDDALSAQLASDDAKAPTQLVRVDQWGRTRQQITVDASMHPVRSVWFDRNMNPIRSLTVAGRQAIDGFVLPKRIDLSTASGQRVSVWLERYVANVSFDETLFVLGPPSS